MIYISPEKQRGVKRKHYQWHKIFAYTPKPLFNSATHFAWMEAIECRHQDTDDFITSLYDMRPPKIYRPIGSNWDDFSFREKIARGINPFSDAEIEAAKESILHVQFYGDELE